MVEPQAADEDGHRESDMERLMKLQYQESKVGSLDPADPINMELQSMLTFMILNMSYMTEQEMLRFDFRQGISNKKMLYASNRKFAKVNSKDDYQKV